MSISTQLSRIQGNRDTIRAKLVELGLASSNDTLDKLATTIEGIINKGAVSVEILEGQTYTIPAGYHNGSGTVKAMTDITGEAEKYKTQAKTVTPTKNQQSITPDTGYYALESVTVGAIPDAYQDVTSVTAAAGNVLAGKVFVTSDGKVVTGTMVNNGAVEKTLSGTLISYTIPAGYHNGSGKVTISLETKSVTPTKSAQIITPSTGKVLTKVNVAAIPDAYQDVTGVTATAADVLSGKKIVDSTGAEQDGTITVKSGGRGITTYEEDTLAGEQPIINVNPDKAYYDGTYGLYLNRGDITATPNEETQTLTPDNNKTVFTKVTVNPIPSNYKNTSDATAEAANVLSGKTAYNASGKITGSMPNNGAVSKILDTTTNGKSYIIPAGYHNGSGKVSITTQFKTVTPNESIQDIYPDEGKVLSSVQVGAIPLTYANTENTTLDIFTLDSSFYSNQLLEGVKVASKWYNASEDLHTSRIVTGRMPNRGTVTQTLDGISKTSYSIRNGYHSGNGKVTFDDSAILEQLESI